MFEQSHTARAVRPLTRLALHGAGIERALRGRRILLLNWRDPLDPQAGGAELYCWQVATRFAEAGALVTYFTARAPGLPRTDVRQGVRVIRRGGRYSVYVQAAEYMAAVGHTFDAIIESQNGIPFQAPVFAPGTPVVRVIHHMHRDQFPRHFGRAVTGLARFLEGPAARTTYRNAATAVVSPSTRVEIRNGLGTRGPVFIVPGGSRRIGAEARATRSTTPSIVTVSRLSEHKRVDLVLGIAPALAERWPGLRIHVVGDGPQGDELRARAAGLGVSEVVRFHGFLPEAERDALVAGAWLAVVPSDHEGWCLTVIEANALGVPAVGRRVAGLRDSIRHGVTGWLAPGEEAFGDTVDTALRSVASPESAERWAERCREWAAVFDWDATAVRLAGVIAGELRDQRGGRPRRGRGRFQHNDMAYLAELDAADAADVAGAAAHGLRTTDSWVLEGGRMSVLLYGCYEADAMATVMRLGYPVLSLRPASDLDLLTGPRYLHRGGLPPAEPAFSQPAERVERVEAGGRELASAGR